MVGRVAGTIPAFSRGNRSTMSLGLLVRRPQRADRLAYLGFLLLAGFIHPI
jgi:hypothetical protein